MKKSLTIILAVILSFGMSLTTFAEELDVSSPLPETKSSKSSPTEKKLEETTKPAVKDDGSLEFPKTSILTEKSSSDFAPLKIKTAKGTPVYIKIYRYNPESQKYNLEPTKTLFIRGDESITVNMAKGYYKLRYCSGSKWYGEEEMFGEYGTYSQLDNRLNFSSYGQGFELSLQIVKDGNATSTLVNREKF